MSDTAVFFSLFALVLLAVPVLWFLHLLEDPWRDRILAAAVILGLTFLVLGIFSARDGAGGSASEAKATFEQLIQAETDFYREHGRYTNDVMEDLGVTVPSDLDVVSVATLGDDRKLLRIVVGVQSNLKHLFGGGWVGSVILADGKPPR